MGEKVGPDPLIVGPAGHVVDRSESMGSVR